MCEGWACQPGGGANLWECTAAGHGRLDEDGGGPALVPSRLRAPNALKQGDDQHNEGGQAHNDSSAGAGAAQVTGMAWACPVLGPHLKRVILMAPLCVLYLSYRAMKS